MHSLGICLGASSIGLVRLACAPDGPRVVSGSSTNHGGNPKAALDTLLSANPDWPRLPMAATGRKFRTLVRLPSLSEPEAVEAAAGHVLGPGAAGVTVISAGGESFLVYGLNAQGRVQDIYSGNKCASGTGEFFLQQLGRMDLGLDELGRMDHDATPYKVSGRCSVFCKSDCTHALNKGAPRQEVAAGLGRMMAGKCLEIMRKLPRDRVLLVGGCAANPYLARFLAQEVGELIVPAEAPWFEALGAALWAKERAAPPGEAPLAVASQGSFARLAPLAQAVGLVDFKEHPRAAAKPGDEAVCGLDVGSTTTKGVVVRASDKAILAGEYLRTGGDPIAAARQVYESLAGQLGPGVDITGLGVTGSGRAIAALHADATAAINEIIAHARAAVHFDPEVDTIFEIGGQDAKYTFLSGGNPCDSAMNEACSAGTGSFLEESASQSLGVATTDIAPLALAAATTPNFNDQCAAFIGSDIKIAAQEGVPPQDILAGLVRSVCVNYVYRVKGNRAVGRRVFMQGGVCYNRAVPVAMAQLTGKPVVVPPEPGLMGALGVALELRRRQEQGLLAYGSFNLAALAALPARRKNSFVCRGGRGGQKDCDRGCVVARIEVGGKVHPFGGVCNRFENLRRGSFGDAKSLDAVQARQRRVFRDAQPPAQARPVVGISRSYLTNTFFPLFNAFFRQLGFDVLLQGLNPGQTTGQYGGALCYPAQLSHDFMAAMLHKRPDAVFLPHVRSVPAGQGQEVSCTCVLLQGEPYYLRGAFPELDAFGPRLLTPTLDFAAGIDAPRKAFVAMGRALGAGSRAAARAFDWAVGEQADCRADLDRLGRQALAELEDTPGQTGVVLFGRAYNAFAAEANKGVPEVFATRQARVIPCDLLPLPGDAKAPVDNMYWGQGRVILAASRVAAAHPRLFGAYVTNFSCGPDSFLLSYFRDEMGAKPSLTLELDSHTAHAGLETRIEAFLDIASIHQARQATPGAPSVSQSARHFSPSAPSVSPSAPSVSHSAPSVSHSAPSVAHSAPSVAHGAHHVSHGASQAPQPGLPQGRTPDGFTPARMEKTGRGPGIRTSSGEWLPLSHKRVRLVVPSMNVFSSRLAARAVARGGVNGAALPAATEADMLLGRGLTTCKECLPLQLTVGTLLDYVAKRPADEVTAYFMPSAKGPCRFGQYHVATSRLIEKLALPDVAVLAPCAADGYGGLGHRVTMGIWRAAVLGDIFEEARGTLLAAAEDVPDALGRLEREFDAVRQAVDKDWPVLKAQLARSAAALASIELATPYARLPKVSLVGEIYVRHDPLSLQGLVEHLAGRGLAVRTSPLTEWIFYADWLLRTGRSGRFSLGARVTQWVKRKAFARIRRAMAPCGLFAVHSPTPEELLGAAAPFISPELSGEAVLTVGAAFYEMLNPSLGVVAIGPFGCMPTRLAEAVLAERFTAKTLARLYPKRARRLPQGFDGNLPLLAVETDGAPFNQLTQARLEAFCLQVVRLHHDIGSPPC